MEWVEEGVQTLLKIAGALANGVAAFKGRTVRRVWVWGRWDDEVGSTTGTLTGSLA